MKLIYEIFYINKMKTNFQTLEKYKNERRANITVQQESNSSNKVKIIIFNILIYRQNLNLI